jgi:hypothetical protein
MPHGNFLYYSTNTLLAYRITNRYFHGIFSVHCAEEYDPDNQTGNPPSSSPALLYWQFRLVAESGDRGNDKIISVKNKLKRVARSKLRTGEITQNEYDALRWEVNAAESWYFTPILYLISREKVGSRAKAIPIDKRANPNSKEYMIDDLKADKFEVISVRLRLVGGLS